MGSCCSTVKSNGAAVVDGAAPEANRADVVDVATNENQSHNHPVQPRNRLKSFRVKIFKLWRRLCLSGTTSLVNESNMDIEFFTAARHLKSLRFRLEAFHTKCIDMRKLFAFREARAAEVVMLKVGGNYMKQTFVPEDFVKYKKFVFNVVGGELICECEVR